LGASNILTILSDGNIGIGTTAPSEALDLQGRLYLADSSAPGTTTNRLYSVSGNLYWDGTDITNIVGDDDWASTTSGAYCFYDNDINNKVKYGALYNWYAVNTAKLCPAGWHVPTDAEWKGLEIFLGMSAAIADWTSFRGTTEGGKVKEVGTVHWSSPNEGATNSTGFTALPGGNRYGEFAGIKVMGVWWSSTEYSDHAYWRALYFDVATISRYDDNKRLGASVRCIKD